jgi:hypothetical protein
MFLGLTSNGAPFPLGFAPITLDYFISFEAITDFAILKTALFGDVNTIGKEAAIELKVEPDNGINTEFEGVIYDMEYIEHDVYKIYIVSKAMKGMMSTEPLYGKGNAINIIKNFYSKAGVKKADVTVSTTSFDNLLFPRTTTIIEALQYILARTVVAGKKGGTKTHCIAAIINGEVLLRGINDKRNDIITDQYLVYNNVIDRRKAVDIKGGLKVGILDDKTDSKEQKRQFPGDSEVVTKRFYSTSDESLNADRANVRQSKTYFNNYMVEATLPFWEIRLGKNIEIKKDNPFNNQVGKKKIIAGLYFVTTQVLMMNFGEKTQHSACRLKLVEELN